MSNLLDPTKHRQRSDEIADRIMGRMCMPDQTFVMQQSTARPVHKNPSWHSDKPEIVVTYADKVCRPKF